MSYEDENQNPWLDPEPEYGRRNVGIFYDQEPLPLWLIICAVIVICIIAGAIISFMF